jgi:hypothetical protein
MLNFLLVFITAATTFVSADHTFTLTNNCGNGVPVYVDSAYSPVAYVNFIIKMESKEIDAHFASCRLGRSQAPLALDQALISFFPPAGIRASVMMQVHSPFLSFLINFIK